MIYESSYWKDQLEHDTSLLLEHLGSCDYSDADSLELTSFHLEKYIFVACFSMRKLMDSNKMSDQFESQTIKFTKYPKSNNNSISFMDRWDFFDYYDSEKPYQHTMSVRKLCNSIIHSFIFWVILNEDGNEFKNIYFNSDNSKDNFLYEIDLESFFDIVKNATQDDISHLEMHRDKSGTWKINKKS